MDKDKIKQKIKEIQKNSKSLDKHSHFKILSEIAQLRLGKIKDGEVYLNAVTKITFIDKLGNEFQMAPDKIKSGRWSPYESGKVHDPEYHMKQLEEIALSKGGKVKEGEVYINNIKKMIFIDKSGNEFQMAPANIKSGRWSPYESGKVLDPEYHMKQLEEIALSKSGKIKEGEIYVNAKTKMIFIDKSGNEFQMAPDAVKSGSWSPYESGNIYNDSEYHMKQIEEIVSKKGGKIKEGEIYVNAKTKMTFIDKSGNEFQMKPNAVKSGSWSPYESGNVRDSEYHTKELKEIVSKKGGKIKEGEIYVNATTKMSFIDQLGNEFETTPANIKIGRWSPFEKSCSEHICRQIIEQLYNKKFNSSWEIIQREGKRNLQLDGYCPELKIAFEYQGEQHTTGWFFGEDKNRQKQNLIKNKERDNEKKQICIEKDILLLEINYYNNSKNIKNEQDIINQTIEDVKKSYTQNNMAIPNFITQFNIEKIKIDFSKISHLVLMQQKLEEIVLSKGGKVKEGEKYINAKIKMSFIDQLGNEFEMLPNKIKNGQWSPFESEKSFDKPKVINTILNLREDKSIIKSNKKLI